MASAGHIAQLEVSADDGATYVLMPEQGYSGLTVDMAEGTRDVQGGGIGVSELTGHTEGTVSFSVEDNATSRGVFWTLGPAAELKLRHSPEGAADNKPFDLYTAFCAVTISATSGDSVMYDISGDILAEPATGTH